MVKQKEKIRVNKCHLLNILCDACSITSFVYYLHATVESVMISRTKNHTKKWESDDDGAVLIEVTSIYPVRSSSTPPMV